MEKYQKPATIVVKLKYETLLQDNKSDANQGSGNSREYRSGWKDEE